MVSEKEIQEAKEKYKSLYLNALTPLNFLKRSSLVFPNRKAVVYRDKTYNWKEFAERVYRLSNGLKEKGIKRYDRVAILSRNNNAALEASYGIVMASGVSVPINYRLSRNEIAYILNHSESIGIIYESIFAETIKEIYPGLETTKLFIEIESPGEIQSSLGIPYEQFLKDSAGDAVPIPIRDENDMISIVYTSGTTGLPKGCVHTHRGSYLNAMGEIIEAQLHSTSSYLWTLPMFHCQGWGFVWGITAVGAKHICLDEVRAEQVYQLIEKEKVTHMCGAPTVYKTIAEYMGQNYLRFPRKVKGFIAGAPPTPKIITEAEYVGFDLIQVYGLTEVYGPHTICEWQSDEWDSLPVAERVKKKAAQGVPYVTCTMVKVVDENMQKVPWDGKTSGEIVMKGNNVMQWYFREEDKTEEAFHGGWFHSGDAAVVQPDGYIQIVDRIKDIIITGGENVSSIEVEKVISEHPMVADVAVIGKPDEKWGEIVKAIIQPKPGMILSKEEIVKWCRDRLTRYKVPRDIIFDTVPRSSTGKIQKGELKKREREAVLQ